MRCIELTAFGLANCTRVSSSMMITPSPTRGEVSSSISSRANGNEPSAIILANRVNVSWYVRSSSPGRRDDDIDRSRVTSPTTTSLQRTGMHCTRTRSFVPNAGVSFSTISPVRSERIRIGRSTSSTIVPTMSVG